MPTLPETRRRVGDHLAKDISGANRIRGFQYSVSDLAAATSTQPTAIGRVSEEIIGDLKRREISVSYQAISNKRYFVVSASIVQ